MQPGLKRRLSFVFKLIVIISTQPISSSSAQETINPKQSFLKFNQESVCDYTYARLYEAYQIIQQDQNEKHKTKVGHLKSGTILYRYKNPVLESDFFIADGTNHLVRIILKSNALQQNDRNSDFLLKRLGGEIGSIDTPLSLGCDTNTLQIHVRGKTVTSIEISSNFID